MTGGVQIRELGVFIPVGSREVVPAAWALIEDADSSLPDALRAIFAEACREIRDIEARVRLVERQLASITEQLPAVDHLQTIPGVGLLTSTALELREWADQLAKTHVHNKAAVAVANKLARIVWAVWKHEKPFALMARVA